MNLNDGHVNRVRIAVSPEQRAVLQAARQVRDQVGRLATFADVRSMVFVRGGNLARHLRVLERLGLIRWQNTIEVLGEPDGLFFSPETLNAGFRQESRAVVSRRHDGAESDQ